MADFISLLAILGFFALARLAVTACDHIAPSAPSDADATLETER